MKKPIEIGWGYNADGKLIATHTKPIYDGQYIYACKGDYTKVVKWEGEPFAKWRLFL